MDSKRIEKEFGVSIPQLLTLQYLDIQDDFKATSTQIKNHLELNASTITGIINRLISKDFVAKIPNPKDGRGYYIILTAKGSRLLKKSPVTLQEKVSKKIESLSEVETDTLYKGVWLLINLLEAQDLDAAPLITLSDDLSKSH
ncbi:MAG: MarR family winged helix-turn-helix transcriptional regulator [Flagellimonas marinaquae]